MSTGVHVRMTFDLTSAQLGIWNAQRLDPDSPYYLVGDVLEVSGSDRVDAAVLAEAVRITNDAAETLRLRVLDSPDGPRQLIDGSPAQAPPIIDLRGEPDPVAAAEAFVRAERSRAAEALRGMTDRDGGEPVLRIPPAGAVTAADVLTRGAVTPDGLDDLDDLDAVAEAHLAEARAGTDLRRGPLLRAVWLDASAAAPGRLLLVAHHVAVDGASWRILVDVAHLYEAGSSALPRTGTSYLAWARALRAAVPARRAELLHWRRVTADVAPLGARLLDPARDRMATAVHRELRLDPDTAHAVLTAPPAAQGTAPDAVLLAAVALAVRAWRGDRVVTLAREGHGRPDRMPDGSGPADLSATVGWLSASHPVRVEPGDPARTLAAVAEQLDAAGDGLGHGILGDLVEQDAPRIAVNYLGRLPTAAAERVLWRPAPGTDPIGSGGDADLPQPRELMVNAVAVDGRAGTELVVRIFWAPGVFPGDEPAALVAHLRAALLALARAA